MPYTNNLFEGWYQTYNDSFKIIGRIKDGEKGYYEVEAYSIGIDGNSKRDRKSVV